MTGTRRRVPVRCARRSPGSELVGDGEPVKVGRGGLAGNGGMGRAAGTAGEPDAEGKQLRGAVLAALGGVVDGDGVHQLARDGLVAFQDRQLGAAGS